MEAPLHKRLETAEAAIKAQPSDVLNVAGAHFNNVRSENDDPKKDVIQLTYQNKRAS